MNSRTVRGSANSSRNHLRVPNQAHRKRNLAEYEGELDVDEQLLEAMLRVAREVEQRLASLIVG